MGLKEKLMGILVTIFLSVFALIPLFETKIDANALPQKLYQVYLDGKSIGIIKSKDALEKYINDEQNELKEKYNVNTVYLPQDLYIEEYVGYTDDIVSEKKIYEEIKDEKPFTIRGYVITIDKGDNKVIKINTLKKEYFDTAVNNTVKAFVPEKDLKKYINGEQEEIKTTGAKIENLYVQEENNGKGITIKEALISSNEQIFTNEKELTKYLLFGNLNEAKEYTVKEGDTIEAVAFNNSLGVNEFLIVNPQFTSENNLLAVGQKVDVSLISPIITIVEEEHIVEDKEVSYKTEIKYESTKPYGTVEVTQQGENGLQRVTQKLKKSNGEIIQAVIDTSATEVLKPTINRIEVRGTYTINGPVTTGSGSWFWPTNTPYIITSYYTYRINPISGMRELHDGIDISGTGYGSPIYASDDGNVYSSGYDSTGGNQIIINHNNGYYTIYAHMSKLYVIKGQTVKRGQIIGLMGHTGWATGTHLHFGVFYGGPPYYGGRAFNPFTLFR